MRKCLTVKGSLQDIQNGGCSLVSKICVCQSGVSNSTSGDFSLDLSTVA